MGDLSDLVDGRALRAALEKHALGGVEDPLLDLAGVVAGRAAPAPNAALGRSALHRRRHVKPFLHLPVIASGPRAVEP